MPAPPTQVSVTVTYNSTTGKYVPAPAIGQDPVDMRGKGASAPIQWLIATAGWTFTNQGIAIDNNSSGQFFNPQIAEQGRRFNWVDKNDDGLTHKYTINVQDSQGHTGSNDPTIINQGQTL